ncbi:hypothetical protein quinque_003586 [Culex quinquefasciatus]
MTVLDEPDTLNMEATFLIHQGASHLQGLAAEERRNRDRQAVRWGDLGRIEPSHEKYLYIRLRSLLLRKNNPADLHRYANLVPNEDTRRHKERGRLSNGVSPTG